MDMSSQKLSIDPISESHADASSVLQKALENNTHIADKEVVAYTQQLYEFGIRENVTKLM